MAKFDKDLKDKFLKLVSNGNFVTVAAGACGIDRKTIYNHIKSDSAFSTSLKKAKAERITSLIEKIRNDQSWQSAAWACERLLPRFYHLPTSVEQDVVERLKEIERRLSENEKINNDKN